MSLNFRIVTDPHNDLIRVDFQRKVGSIGFTLAEAIRFRELWDQHISALMKYRSGGDNGKEKHS